jgi:D-alanyl-D-alanine carboxypeptidase
MYKWTTLHTLTFAFVFTVALFAYQSVFSSQEPVAKPTVPQYQVLSELPDISAPAYLVFDLENGEVLASKESEEVMPIASVTKLATAVAAVNTLDLEKEVKVTYSDLMADGRAGKLEAGDSYLLRELLFPLLLESSNDAAALFERVTEDKIIDEMNSLASLLGMTDTVFADASGLSDNNVSTAEDLSLLLSYIGANEPYVFDITALKQYIGPHTGWANNSPVIDSGYIGGKHGYTYAANRTLAVVFEEDFGATKRPMGYVILGSEDLASDTEMLRSFVSSSVVFE